MRVHVWRDSGAFSSLTHPNYFLFCLNTHMCVSACLFVRVFLFAPSPPPRLPLLLPGSACLCLCLLMCRVSFAKLSGSRTAPISKPGRRGSHIPRQHPGHASGTARTQQHNVHLADNRTQTSNLRSRICFCHIGIKIQKPWYY